MKNEKAMFALSYGLYVLTARENEKDNGCIINTAMQVTDSPKRLMIAVNKANLTHDQIVATGLFNLSVLSEKTQFSTFQRFGFQSGRNAEKFAGCAGKTLRLENGLLVWTEGVSAWLSCKVVSMQDLGTHTLFLADVVDGDVLSADPSVTYTYYQAHIKPKPEAPKAPTGTKRWVCRICGYVYEGEELPPDYICPICKHPASDFDLVEG